MRISSYKAINQFYVGGAGNGNSHRFEVIYENDMKVLASCERDVAYDYILAGQEVPADLQGPYDGYGNKVA